MSRRWWGVSAVVAYLGGVTLVTWLSLRVMAAYGDGPSVWFGVSASVVLGLLVVPLVYMAWMRDDD